MQGNILIAILLSTISFVAILAAISYFLYARSLGANIKITREIRRRREHRPRGNHPGQQDVERATPYYHRGWVRRMTPYQNPRPVPSHSGYMAFRKLRPVARPRSSGHIPRVDPRDAPQALVADNPRHSRYKTRQYGKEAEPDENQKYSIGTESREAIRTGKGLHGRNPTGKQYKKDEIGSWVRRSQGLSSRAREKVSAHHGASSGRPENELKDGRPSEQENKARPANVKNHAEDDIWNRPGVSHHSKTASRHSGPRPPPLSKNDAGEDEARNKDGAQDYNNQGNEPEVWELGDNNQGNDRGAWNDDGNNQGNEQALDGDDNNWDNKRGEDDDNWENEQGGNDYDNNRGSEQVKGQTWNSNGADNNRDNNQEEDDNNRGNNKGRKKPSSSEKGHNWDSSQGSRKFWGSSKKDNNRGNGRVWGD
ncbi:hypothetical protein N7454_000880 [Penicillium verhagenii]|nr:hypothetical protein N7454_000880 [Penicillium verhagenii]